MSGTGHGDCHSERFLQGRKVPMLASFLPLTTCRFTNSVGAVGRGEGVFVRNASLAVAHEIMLRSSGVVRRAIHSAPQQLRSSGERPCRGFSSGQGPAHEAGLCQPGDRGHRRGSRLNPPSQSNNGDRE